MTAHLLAIFPGLRRTAFKVTSPQDRTYNCVAFACGDTGRWWWPDRNGQYFWPEDAPREESVDAFSSMLRERGYEPCEDPSPEPGVEKIALFVDDTGQPTHAAYLPENGAWMSKLGNAEDIQHRLRALKGAQYGSVEQIFCREADSSESGRGR